MSESVPAALVQPRTGLVERVLTVYAVLGYAFIALVFGAIVLLVVAYSVASNLAYSHYDAVDIGPLRGLIGRALPLGSSVAQAQAMFGERHITTFIAHREFEPLSGETTFAPLPSFQSGMAELESYPQGKAIYAETNNRRDGTASGERYLKVWLFFDRKGRFTGSTIDESFASL